MPPKDSKKSEGDPSPFGLSTEELFGFVSDREEGIKSYKSYGGRAQNIAGLLKTDVVAGRSDTAELEKARLAQFGRNVLPEADDVTFFGLLVEALSDKMVLILIASAVLSLILGLTVPDPHTGKIDWEHGWVEGSAILASVFIVAMVTSINNYQKELKFKELSKAVPPNLVRVVRKGAVAEVKDNDLTVGDVIFLNAGMICPIDGVLIKGQGFKMDESTTTGENDDLEKTVDLDPIFRSGTNVLEGEGYVLVTGVGEQSLAGRIAMSVRGEKEDTPLQEKLDGLADQIGKLGMAAATLMFVVLSARELYRTYVLKTQPLNIKKFLDFLVTAITIVVVAVPEGLPLSVTIALAYSVKQMMLENNLVRHLAACETMGSATTICTDKTGTLTQNEMTVIKAFIAGKVVELNGDRKHDIDYLQRHLMPVASRDLLEKLTEGISVNSTAAKKGTDLHGNSKYTGNKTEQAMLIFVEKLGTNPMQERVRHGLENVQAYPFTSARKSMTTCIRLPGGTMRYHIKGASEIVLETCSNYYAGTEVRRLNDDVRRTYMNTINDFARRRLRTLAVAYSDVKGKSEFDKDPEIPPELTLLGILGIEDPIRPEVEGAVGQCKAAGVVVRMVTGDNKTTAISIAKKAGIYGTVYAGRALGEPGLAMEGKHFRELAKSASRLNTILPRLQVLARASPLDKEILVKSLMERGEVVAVTGDGTNDAPALRHANVGFAMNTGTEVAKTASDVVILDDNFKSIVTAMKWGRNVNDNILKFIQFQTTVNVAAVSIAFIGAVTSSVGESPLKPVHLLWLNLIMDTMAALALATEPPTDKLLQRPPRAKEAALITRRCWVNILGQALYQIAIQLWLLNGGHKFFGVQKGSIEHQTVIFNVFVLMQVFNEFNARHLDRTVNVFKGLSRAPLFVGIIVVTLAVQYIGVTYCGAVFKACPLSPKLWRKCGLVSAVPLAIGALLRFIPVSEPHVPIGHDAEVPEDDPANVPKPRITFQQAAYRVIAQLKVAGALSAAASRSS